MARPKFAGTRIAAVASTVGQSERPVVLDQAGPRPVGVASFDVPMLDADERGVAWMANGCVLYAPVDAATPTEPPAGPCPRVDVDFEDLDQTLHGRRLHVAVACAAAPATGCRGTVIMHLHGVAGRGRFHVDPGEEGVATVRLTRRAARTLRRRVRRQGDAAILMSWRVPDGRPAQRGTLFVIGRVR